MSWCKHRTHIRKLHVNMYICNGLGQHSNAHVHCMCTVCVCELANLSRWPSQVSCHTKEMIKLPHSLSVSSLSLSHTHTHTHIHTHTHTQPHTQTNTQTQTHTHTQSPLNMYTHVHTCVMWLYTSITTLSKECSDPYIHAHTYTQYTWLGQTLQWLASNRRVIGT